MTTLRAQMAADLAELHGDDTVCPSETVTWKPLNNGTPVSGVVIVFDSNGRGRSESGPGQMEIHQGLVTVTVAQRATVNVGDRFTRIVNGSESDWTVDSIALDSPTVRQLNVSRTSKTAFLAPGELLNHTRGAG